MDNPILMVVGAVVWVLAFFAVLVFFFWLSVPAHSAATNTWRECHMNRRSEAVCRQCRFEPYDGKRVVRERFGVDEDVCTGDHACIRLSGCPSLSVKHTDDPLKDDPVAAIDDGCVGCGNCGDVSEAAVLCPSFYRADIISNPTWFDRTLATLRSVVIGFLQNRRAAARIGTQ